MACYRKQRMLSVEWLKVKPNYLNLFIKVAIYGCDGVEGKVICQRLCGAASAYQHRPDYLVQQALLSCNVFRVLQIA